MKKILLLTLALLCLQIVVAECPECDELYQELTNTELQEETFELQPTITKFLKKETKINIYIDGTDAAITIKEGKLSELSSTPHQKSDIDIRTTKETLKNILTSENQKQALITALKEKQITIKANNLGTKIKLWAAKKVLAKKYNKVTGNSIKVFFSNQKQE